MLDGQQYGYQWYLCTIPISDGAGGVRQEKTINRLRKNPLPEPVSI